MKGNEAVLVGIVRRWPRRFSNPAFSEDRVSFALVVPTIRNTGMSTCIVDCAAETEDTRDVSLELRPGDQIEVFGWLRARSKKVSGRMDRQAVVEVVAEKIIVLPSQGEQGSPPDFLRATHSTPRRQPTALAGI